MIIVLHHNAISKVIGDLLNWLLLVELFVLLFLLIELGGLLWNFLSKVGCTAIELLIQCTMKEVLHMVGYMYRNCGVELLCWRNWCGGCTFGREVHLPAQFLEALRCFSLEIHLPGIIQMLGFFFFFFFGGGGRRHTQWCSGVMGYSWFYSEIIHDRHSEGGNIWDSGNWTQIGCTKASTLPAVLSFQTLTSFFKKEFLKSLFVWNM